MTSAAEDYHYGVEDGHADWLAGRVKRGSDGSVTVPYTGPDAFDYERGYRAGVNKAEGLRLRPAAETALRDWFGRL